MEIFITLSPTADGYFAKIDKLPDFELHGNDREAILSSLPEALKHFISEWESTTALKSITYQKEFPVIQRIKSRGFYQSTIYRFQDILTQKQSERLDLELIHCLQRKDYEALMV